MATSDATCRMACRRGRFHVRTRRPRRRCGPPALREKFIAHGPAGKPAGAIAGSSTSMPEPALTFREARREDLAAIVSMLADDPLGSTRERLEDPLPRWYHDAFDAIAADPNNELLVATRAGEVVATLQLTFTPTI